MKYLFVLLLLIGCFSIVLSQEQSIKIKYISAENVYLDAGRDRGLHMQDTLEVRRQNRVLAKLTVVYVADHSASCKIISKANDILPGDQAILVSQSHPEPKTLEQPQQTQIQLPAATKKSPSRQSKRKTLQGSISAQAYYWDDQMPSNLDFTQPTVHLNLRATELAGQHLGLYVRTRGRYDRRSRGYSTQVPQNEWRNRIYQFYLDYANPDAFVNVKIGRIITNPLSGVGYVDGLMAHANLSSKFKVGALAGTQPEWQYADFQTSIQKYAAFTAYKVGSYQTNYYESTLAFTGEYHGMTVSREYFYLNNQLSWRRFLRIYQSAELDFNRGWRKEKTGQAVNLTNFYYDMAFDIASWMSAGISADRRKNYWTYEYRTIADSLFDVLTRRGIRGQLSFRFAGGHSIGISSGLQKRDTDSQPTYSYTLNYNNSDLLRARWLLNLYTAGFSSALFNGLTSSIRLGKQFGNAFNVSIRYSLSSYQIKNGNSRANSAVQVANFWNISSKMFLNYWYEYAVGDDEQGRRVWVEVGHRL